MSRHIVYTNEPSWVNEGPLSFHFSIAFKPFEPWISMRKSPTFEYLSFQSFTDQSLISMDSEIPHIWISKMSSSSPFHLKGFRSGVNLIPHHRPRSHPLSQLGRLPSPWNISKLAQYITLPQLLKLSCSHCREMSNAQYITLTLTQLHSCYNIYYLKGFPHYISSVYL